jgi:hypothetical protein
MRSTQDSRALICLFVDDSPEGGCIVSTPDGEMNTRDMNGDEPFYLKDGREIFYPGWCEW